MTAGLEAKLLLANGARVMLRRNIDTKQGLVNGAIGTVLSITKLRVKVKFDHITEPYKVERVQSRFMAMKNFYVYREQFPLILAYAVTIHKCQGLSLDCAIVDLSDKVFSAGMAYVALSRVRSLAGLHLSAFDPNSIIVSTSCLKEVNRLREAFRSDLPLYNIPVKSAAGQKASKRKLTGKNDVTNPAKKTKVVKAKPDPVKKPTKRKLSELTGKNDVANPAKKTKMVKVECDPVTKQAKRKPSEPLDDPPAKRSNTDDDDCVETGEEPWLVDGRWIHLRYHQVNEDWQHCMCAILGLNFVRSNRLGGGGPDVILTRPLAVKRIGGDGNCLFRCLSYVLTGSQEQYHEVRTKICDHLVTIAHFMLEHHLPSRFTSIDQYFEETHMNRNYVWGSEIEMLTFAHLTNTNVFSYDTEYDRYTVYTPCNVDLSLEKDLTTRSVYLKYSNRVHFEVVVSTCSYD